MKSFPNINKQEQNNISVFIPLKPKNRAMNLQQYVFTLSTQLSIQSLVNKPPLPISVVSGLETGHGPIVPSHLLLESKNLYLRRRRLINRFCATISLVRNLSNHSRHPMLNLNSFLGTAPANFHYEPKWRRFGLELLSRSIGTQGIA